MVDFRLSFTPLEVGSYLSEKGVPDDVCEKFQDNEVDGEAFMELTESDITLLVVKIGLVKKILRLRAQIECEKFQESTPEPDKSSGNSYSESRVVDTSTSNAFLSPLSPPTMSPFSPSSDDALSIDSSASCTKFAIPSTWRPTIMDCMGKKTIDDQRRALTPQLRNEVVRDLVAHMFSYNNNPDKAFCTRAAKMLVSKYAFLEDLGERVSGYGSWEKKIIERVHNMKSASRKRQAVDGTDITPKSRRGRPKKQCLDIEQNFSPVRNLNNDEVTVMRNFDCLKKEIEMARPRKEKVIELATLTFSSRRSEILSEADEVTTVGLMEKFQELKLIYVIENEMDLIIGQKDVVQTAMHNWSSKVAPAVLAHGQTLTGKASTLMKKLELEYRGDVERDYKVSLRLLCHLLPKKGVADALSFIYEERKMIEDVADVAVSNPKLIGPRFVHFHTEDGEGQFIIYIEGAVLLPCHTFLQALMIWFSSFYIFNLEYTKEVSEVCLFFQELVFKLPLTKKKTGTYLSVTTDIRKYIT